MHAKSPTSQQEGRTTLVESMWTHVVTGASHHDASHQGVEAFLHLIMTGEHLQVVTHMQTKERNLSLSLDTVAKDTPQLLLHPRVDYPRLSCSFQCVASTLLTCKSLEL